VIHTVGPVYSTVEDRSGVLASCYRASLQVADEVGAHSVAFPAVSTGVFGWPLESAARIAIDAVRSSDTSVDLVCFVLFDQTALAAFTAALAS
jgi:O-acetyl-ADP-ribose deacetylase (regulator of RNase III)